VVAEGTCTNYYHAAASTMPVMMVDTGGGRQRVSPCRTFTDVFQAVGVHVDCKVGS